jgi:hypothetical protein
MAPRVSCTVVQFLRILDKLATCNGTGDLIWFGADMSPNLGPLEKFQSEFASRISSLDDVCGLLRSLSFPQIDFGIFIAVATEENAPGPKHALYSEGPAGRRYHRSEVELLAFDDSYIEITTDRPEVLRHLNEHFPNTTRICDHR